MDRKDPKGYYAILRVAPNASAALIKAAYRHRAMELHPDRNKAPSATFEFQVLTQAYAVLSDSIQRATYDTQATVVEPVQTSDSAESAESSNEPMACSVCSKITAQPRYVVFWEAKSFVVTSQRTPIQGIFCPACAEKAALRASAVTWVLGWWGIPWGPLFSVQAIFANLKGGEQPALINARILTYQAIAFGLRGQSKIAVGIAQEAIKFAKKIAPDEPLRDSLSDTLATICRSAPSDAPKMVNLWRLPNRPFYTQAAFLIAVVLALAIFINSGDAGSSSPRVVTIPSAPQAPTRPAVPIPKPAYVRSSTAPNGTPWPTSAGYINNYRKRNTKGLSNITIDNTQSDSDVFVVLVSLRGNSNVPVRWFFIPAFGRFTAAKLTKGSYRVEYEDLATGRKYRGDVFEAEEIQLSDRIEYSNDTLTLYKVRDGNTDLAEIDDADFDAGVVDSADMT